MGGNASNITRNQLQIGKNFRFSYTLVSLGGFFSTTTYHATGFLILFFIILFFPIEGNQHTNTKKMVFFWRKENFFVEKIHGKKINFYLNEKKVQMVNGQAIDLLEMVFYFFLLLIQLPTNQ